MEFESAGDFLAKLKQEYERRDDELAKVVKLKKIEQREKIMEKFVQDLK